MKILLSASFALCVLMGTAIAQSTSQPAPDSVVRDNGVVRDGFALSKEGRVMMTRDGMTQLVDQEFVLSNGTHLFPNGDIIYYTGDRDHLRPDQLLTLDGMFFDKIHVSGQGVAPVYPPGATKDPVVGISSRDGITVSGADVFIARNGVMEKITKQIRLTAGVVVNPDGTFTTKDGQKVTLRENQILGFDGVLRDAPIHETVPTAPAVLSSPAPANTGR